MEWFGLTDRGRLRPTNQDIFQIAVNESNHTALLVVCDGMGGANAGNVASKFAAKVFVDTIRPALNNSLPTAQRQTLLSDALERANRRVYGLACRQPEFSGMGTTLVATLVWNNEVTIINVGDSRAYLFDGSVLQQVTEDHSYVAEMYRQGHLTKQAARTHSRRNLITRAVGVSPTVEGDLFELTLQEQETLLLCSDGMSGMAEDEDMAAAMKGRPSLAQMGNALVQLALMSGGRDNITVALFTQKTGKTEQTGEAADG